MVIKNKRMVVAVVTTRHSAQDDRIYYKQALSLVKRLDVTIIAPKEREEEWSKGVKYRAIPRRRSALGRLLSVYEAFVEVRRLAPDYCHVHDLDLALAIPFMRHMTRAKIIYDSHEVFTKDDILSGRKIPGRMKKTVAAVVAALEERFVEKGHHVITAVDANGRAFQNVQMPKTTIYNYPVLEMFDVDPKEVEEARKKYSERLPIIYQGTMSMDRGLMDMLEALVILKRKEPRIVLRLVGEINKELKRMVGEYVRRNHLEDNIEIEGWMRHEKIAVAMKTSIVGLVPLHSTEKYKRAVPIKLLEYMACGLPVVASSLPLVAKYIKESGAGLLYEPQGGEQLALGVLELLADPERRKRMGEAGQRAVRERWNWGKMEEELWQVYEALGERKLEIG